MTYLNIYICIYNWYKHFTYIHNDHNSILLTFREKNPSEIRLFELNQLEPE